MHSNCSGERVGKAKIFSHRLIRIGNFRLNPVIWAIVALLRIYSNWEKVKYIHKIKNDKLKNGILHFDKG